MSKRKAGAIGGIIVGIGMVIGAICLVSSIERIPVEIGRASCRERVYSRV